MKTFYRVAYRFPDNSTIRSPNFLDLRTAQNVVHEMNRMNQLSKEPTGEYYIESADISELDDTQLLRLFRLELITFQEMSDSAKSAAYPSQL